jgi:hypothetical protein
MNTTIPDHRRADMQHLVNRTSTTRPNTAYKGSIVGASGGTGRFLKVALAVVTFGIVWLVARSLIQR